MIKAEAIVESLLEDRSKANVVHLGVAMEQAGIDFTEYFHEMQTRGEPACWYMTWLLSHFIEKHPDRGNQVEELTWNTLSICKHEGMQRDLWRTLSFIQISEELSGAIYDRASKVIASSNNKIAIRAHAMLCAFNIAKPYPELRSELTLILEEVQKEESAGIRSRAKNLLARLEKLSPETNT